MLTASVNWRGGQRFEDLVPGPDPAARAELDEGLVEDRLVAARDRGRVSTRERQFEGTEPVGIVLLGHQ